MHYTDSDENEDHESPIDWDDLYFDLKNERATLVIGPEFYNQDGKTVKEKLYKELTKNEDHGILHFYPNNGIFIFQSERYKVKAQKLASQFYKSLKTDNNILQKIIELPFRMIINMNPDTALRNKYQEKDIECQYEYYTWKPRKIEKEITEPDEYYPLIFNLFGSNESFESLILDFEDIFDHLRNLLNNVNVPSIIRSVLNETDTYIFIGCRLEKWDTQLLFRYLNMKEHCFDDSSKNYTTNFLDIDNYSESFFRQQFNLKYYGAPVDFVNEVHKKYFELAIAEGINVTLGSSLKQVISNYIMLDEPLKALNYFTANLNTNDKDVINALILVKSSFGRYMYLKNKKLETYEHLELLRRQIKQSILTLLNSI